MSTTAFLVFRVAHILLAAIWIGATVFMSFLLMPVINASGPAGGQIMVSLNRKGLSAFFASLGGLTVLTGIVLFWRFTGGFSPEVSRSSEGMAYTIGGVAGLLAVIIGGSVIGRSAKKAVDLIEKLPTLGDAAQKNALMQEVNTLTQRMSTFGLVVLVLQVAALVAMSIAHYI